MKMYREGKYSNRSRWLQSAVDRLAEPEKRTRLVRELASWTRAKSRASPRKVSEPSIGPNTERRGNIAIPTR